MAVDGRDVGSGPGHPLRHIKDPIHDMMPVDPIASEIIDKPEFQRLRSIKQLGTTYYVWPGASHNRFEHCLGVGYLAREMALHLQRDQPELGITDRDVKCVHIAGLCHDLGHGPWSHVWDGVFIPKALPNSTWTHEEGSEMMFDHLLDTSETPIAIDADERTFIKALIRGDPSRCTRKEKAFLFDIVANKRNGIDVDKFDYILRDTKEVGVSKNVHLQRIIKSARVIDDEICYDIKDADALFEVCQTRYSLHKSFYNHKTAKAIEYMVIDALLLADPYMNISRRIHDPVLYRFLTDNILDRIEESALDPKLCDALAPAREIVHRVRTRKLYKMVDYGPVPWKEVQRYKEHVTPARIATIAKRGLSQDDLQAAELCVTLKADNIIVDFSPLHYGMKDKNPLDYIKFYSKNNPNKAESADPDSFSTILPAVFGEYMLRIYTKDPKYFGIVQAAYRKLLELMSPTNAHGLMTPVASLSQASLSSHLSGSSDSCKALRSESSSPSTEPVGASNLTEPVVTASQRSKPRSRVGQNKFMNVPAQYNPPTGGVEVVTRAHARKRERDDGTENSPGSLECNGKLKKIREHE